MEKYLEKISQLCIAPHPDIHQGELEFGDEVVFDVGCWIDLTGNIKIGSYCMIGRHTQIYTHDHYHEGRKPLLLLQKEKGVKWLDKTIGNDVWLHGCIVLMQCQEIADGCVVGAGSVVTKSLTEPYGIYAGNPAVKIGER